jgi:hypothetical protein
VITNFVGSKSQKDVIKKSKDLAQKRQDEMEAQQAVEREQKERVEKI